MAVLGLMSAGLAGCSSVQAAFENEDSAAVESVAAAESVWDADVVHVISVDVDDDAFTAMVETYQSSEEKEWIRADVTIDGTTFRDVGMRLKGNSSLRGVDADSSATGLPWLIDLDKFVDGQSLEGWESFIVRGSNSETALNEAVALDLLTEAGLASQEAVATRFSVNGEDEQLRLVVQDLDSKWDEATFGTDGTLYKSEAGGDWSYRGEDAEAYTDIFDIEAGSEDYAPLTEFLQWLEESSDEEFVDGLDEKLDVEAFADYLAFEDLVGNFDDIDGPGNNSYLRWDEESGRMTVVAWDHNLAFGGMGMGRGGFPGRDGDGAPPEGFDPPEGFEPPESMELPEGMEMPEGMAPPDGGFGGRGDGPGRMGGDNVLSERFRETPEFAALYDDAVARLQQELYDSGTAQEILGQWRQVLQEGASDLVETDTIKEEADQIASYFDGHAVDDSAQQGEAS
jgi:spore coat protein CotH